MRSERLKNTAICGMLATSRGGLHTPSITLSVGLLFRLSWLRGAVFFFCVNGTKIRTLPAHFPHRGSALRPYLACFSSWVKLHLSKLRLACGCRIGSRHGFSSCFGFFLFVSSPQVYRRCIEYDFRRARTPRCSHCWRSFFLEARTSERPWRICTVPYNPGTEWPIPGYSNTAGR